MKYLFILFISFFIIKNTATAQSDFGILEGKLTYIETYIETGEGLFAASVTLYKTGETMPIAGGPTDINGHYSIDSIPVGVYDIEFSYVGFSSLKRTDVKIKNNVTKLSLILNLQRDYWMLVPIKVNTANSADFGTGRVYTSGDIQNMPTKW